MVPGPTLWSTALRACFAGFAALGLDVERIRSESGIDAAALADPDARIPFELTARIWPVAQQQWQKPGLGLQTARVLPFGELGVIDYTIASAPTLAEGLGELGRVFGVVSHGATHFELTRDPRGDGALQFTGVFPAQVRDYALCGFACRIQHLGATLDGVELVGPPYDDVRSYERVLGLRPRFDAEVSLLRIGARELDLPRTDERYRGLAPIVGREAERLLRDVPDPSMTAQARRLIARLLPSGTPDVERLARGLSVSRRTLQRRLADEGTTVRALIELTREELARRYLEADRLRVAEIAYLLGYSEPGTFTTAFKRWTGTAPSEHRHRSPGA